VKRSVFWDMTPCSSPLTVNRRFGGGACPLSAPGKGTRYVIPKRLSAFNGLLHRVISQNTELFNNKNYFLRRMPPSGRFRRVNNRLTLFLVRVISSTLKMEATLSSETSVYNKPTRRHIPEDGILHSQRREKLKFYCMIQHR
jgi:hypothetical protein